MIALAPSLGYTQLELGVFSDNERAIRLYSRFGFQEWGRTKNAFRLGDGTCFDEILMGLQLTESEMDSANPGRPEGSSGISTIERMNEEHAVLRNFGLPLLTWKSGMRILDAGCGGGKTIEEMLRLSPDSVIDGIDFSETSVQKARELNRAELGSRVHVVHGDVGSLPYEDGTFDLVTAVETVYFWPDILGSLREIRRVLKKGGCAEILNEGSDPSILEVWPHIDGFMKVYRPEELKELMELAGFSKVRIERGEDQLVAAIAVK
jgi:SAM-dependent methyltransferase